MLAEVQAPRINRIKHRILKFTELAETARQRALRELVLCFGCLCLFVCVCLFVCGYFHTNVYIYSYIVHIIIFIIIISSSSSIITNITVGTCPA